MICDIYIKTHERDAPYHVECMRSIDKYCTGFRKTVVVHGEHPRGYLAQQSSKMHADQHTDADFILVTDSDTLFTCPITPETYMVGDKSIWLHTPFDTAMREDKNVKCWIDVMWEFFGHEPKHEMMRRQPFMVPAWALKALREFCVERHGQSLHDYIMSKRAFTEWNVLGMFMWEHFHDRIHWIDTTKDELPELTVRQFWSWDDIGKNREEIERILA